MLSHGLVEITALSNCVRRHWLLPESCSEAALLLASIVSGAWSPAPIWLISYGIRMVLKKEPPAACVMLGTCSKGVWKQMYVD